VGDGYGMHRVRGMVPDFAKGHISSGRKGD
jgi:hypothetical protein